MRGQSDLTERIDYLFLASGAEEISIAGSRRVLDEPARVGEDWLWASDHIGVLTMLVMR